MMARSIWLASLAAALALAACGKKDAEAPAEDAAAETPIADAAEGDAASLASLAAPISQLQKNFFPTTARAPA
ncbi:MAG TPA: hypothetical protein P5072_07590 [Parvularculaceae bacterium]|nr:hypothetical protein [Parvularculaceae bacterium]